MKPTLILVHGAFAESSSWNGVAQALLAEGYRVIAFANPLRGLASDAALLSDLVRSVEGPVVLVGHSYGGAVLTNVSASDGQVVSAVYVAAFALEAGENCLDASSLVPGSTLGDTHADGPAERRGHRHLHRAGEVPRPVHRRPVRAGRRSDGRQPAPRHDGGPGGALGRHPALAVRADLVPLRGARPQHPGRRPPRHGRARRGEADGGDRGGLARGRDLPPGRDRADHPRGRGRVVAPPSPEPEADPWSTQVPVSPPAASPPAARC